MDLDIIGRNEPLQLLDRAVAENFLENRPTNRLLSSSFIVLLPFPFLVPGIPTPRLRKYQYAKAQPSLRDSLAPE